MELDLQSLFELLCTATHWLRPRSSPPPPAFGLIYEGAIGQPTEYIFHCKRAILFISSSKILTPHPPLRPASLSSPRNKGGGTHSPGGEGDGGSIFWKTSEIGLPSYSKICTLWVSQDRRHLFVTP